MRIEATTETTGQRINEDKTKFEDFLEKVMAATTSSKKTIDNLHFGIIKEFVFFGGVVDSNNNMMVEVKRKIMLTIISSEKSILGFLRGKSFLPVH